jgi:hypothetical protein
VVSARAKPVAANVAVAANSQMLPGNLVFMAFSLLYTLATGLLAPRLVLADFHALYTI